MPLSLVNVIWLMIVVGLLDAGGDVFPGLVQEPRERAHLFYSLNALSMAAFAFCELWIMRVQTIDEGVVALQWAHVALTDGS